VFYGHASQLNGLARIAERAIERGEEHLSPSVDVASHSLYF
jgi:hypothetical protein